MSDQQSQAIAIPFNRGIDTKTDAKMVQAPFLAVLENGVFQSGDTIQKRNGLTQLGNAVQGGGTVTATALAAHNSELLAFDGVSAYSYSANSSKWLSRGAAPAVSLATAEVIHDAIGQTYPGDMATANGVTVFAYGGVNATVQDNLTGAYYSRDVNIGASLGAVRCALSGNLVYVFWIGLGDGTLRVSIVDTTAPAAWVVANLTVASDAVVSSNPADGVFDAVALNTGGCAVAYRNSAGRAAIGLVTSAGALAVSPAPIALGTDNNLLPANIATGTDTLGNTTGFAPYLGTIASTTAKAWQGTRSLKLTCAPGLGSAATFTVPCTGSTQYTFSCYVLADAGAPGTLQLGGSVLDNVGGGGTLVIGSLGYVTFVRYVLTFTTNPGATSMTFSLGENIDDDPIYYLDGFQLELGASATGWAKASLGAMSLVQDGTYLYLALYDSNVPVTKSYSRSLSTLANNAGWSAAGVTLAATAVSGGIGGAIFSGALVWVQNWTATSNIAIVTQNVATGAPIGGLFSGFASYFGLASRPFVYGSKLYMCVTSLFSAGQRAHFLIDSIGHVYAMSAMGYAPGPGYSNGALVASVSQSGATFSWVAAKLGVFGGIAGIMRINVNLAEPTAYIASAKLGEQTHFPGAIMRSYDGAQLTEHGFLQFPDNISQYGTASTGGFMSNGTYLYKATYEWQDTAGQRHSSATSEPFSVTLTGGTATQVNTLTVSGAWLTSKPGAMAVLWRTTNGGTIYYRAPTIIAGGMADTSSDATIATHEILYTQGGELDNDPPPPAGIIAVGKGRIFLVPYEDPNTVAYSKQQVYGQGVAFSLALTKRIYSTGGPITALAVMDDKVIVFKASTILFFYGDGPTPAGTNDTFTDPQLIASDVGCSQPASIVNTSEGVMFASAKGICLLNRSLQLSYPGAPAEAYSSQVISSATLLSNANQVRFVCATGKALAYHYYFAAPFDEQPIPIGQWATFTNYAALCATLWQGTYVVLKPNGRVWQENAGFIDGDGAAICLRVKTGWFKMPAVTGFARLNEWVLLGIWKSLHRLICNLYFDFSSISTVQLIYDGSQTPPAGDVYQMRNRPPNQLCEAAQFEFYDDFTGISPTGEGYAVNNLTMLIEPQPGLARLASSKTL